MLRCAATALSSRRWPPACWTPVLLCVAAVAAAPCLAQGLHPLAVVVAGAGLAELLQESSQQAADCRSLSAEQQNICRAEGIGAVSGRAVGGMLKIVPLGGVSALQSTYEHEQRLFCTDCWWSALRGGGWGKRSTGPRRKFGCRRDDACSECCVALFWLEPSRNAGSRALGRITRRLRSLPLRLPVADARFSLKSYSNAQAIST